MVDAEAHRSKQERRQRWNALEQTQRRLTPLIRLIDLPQRGLTSQRRAEATRAVRASPPPWEEEALKTPHPFDSPDGFAPKGLNKSAQGRGDASCASVAVALGRRGIKDASPL